MTICIAAICENGKNIVVAADRMFTSPLNVEFETEEHKIEIVSKFCVAMAAGGSAYATEVIDPVRSIFGKRDDALVPDIANAILNQYKVVRNQKLEEQVVLPMLGNDFLVHRAKNFTVAQYLQPQANVYQQIVAISSNYNLNLELLIVGIDKTGAHIFSVSHPGTGFNLDKLGYSAVGSGAIHAVISLSLTAQTTHRELMETLYTVYDAKKSAEVAPGVGRVTDIAVIEESGIWNCPQELFDTLESVSSDCHKKNLPDLKRVKEIYDKQHK
jgi:20S proteasome alpha/beta subunit